MGSGIVPITDIQFQETIQTSDLVLVKFWASWCGPCKVLGAILNSLLPELDGKIRVFEIDTDSNPTSSSEYRIMSLPTVILFKDGKEVDRYTGAPSKSQFKEWVGKHVQG